MIGTRRAVGLYPTIPQNAAGIRHDPPVSVPNAASAIPSATETAAPDELPPGTCPPEPSAPRPHGPRGVPKCGLMPIPENANSVMFVRPTGISPAARHRAITTACAVAGSASANTLLPAAVRSPATSNRSLMLIGIPANGPGARPTRRNWSIASALARAASA